jgi:hypothetical protein
MLVTMMKPIRSDTFIAIFLLIVLSTFAQCALPPHVATSDRKLAYVEQLPSLRAVAYNKAKQGWDSGIDSKVIDASKAYDTQLILMCEGVANRFYPKNHFSAGGIGTLLRKHMDSTRDMARRCRTT